MRIAVIGTGIAGLGAAHALARAPTRSSCSSASARVGGHANTVDVARGDGRLGARHRLHRAQRAQLPAADRGCSASWAWRPRTREMSFSVSLRRLRPRVRRSRRAAGAPGSRLLREILRFLRSAAHGSRATSTPAQTLDAVRRARGLLPRASATTTWCRCASALWSTAPTRRSPSRPRYAVRFLQNHGLLGFRRLRWRTVVGGSRRYVARPARAARRAAAPGAPCAPIDARRRRRHLRDRRRRAAPLRRRRRRHARRRRRWRCSPTPTTLERRLLGAFRTTANETVLHTDACSCRAAALRAAVLELPARRLPRRSAAPDRDVLPQPPPAPGRAASSTA